MSDPSDIQMAFREVYLPCFTEMVCKAQGQKDMADLQQGLENLGFIIPVQHFSA